MRIDGLWSLCDDDIVRPLLWGEVLTSSGLWHATEFLIDTGADRTVLSANAFEALNITVTEATERIGGVGGIVDTVTVTTQIRFIHEAGGNVLFRGDYIACTDYESLDMSVLGRDVMENFALIADQTNDIVCLLHGRHRYKIEQL